MSSLVCNECGCVFDKHKKVEKCPNCHSKNYTPWSDEEMKFFQKNSRNETKKRIN